MFSTKQHGRKKMDKEQKERAEEQDDEETSRFVRDVLNTVQESLNVKRIVRNSVRSVASGPVAFAAKK